MNNLIPLIKNPIYIVSGSIFRTSGNLYVTQYTTNTHSQTRRAVYHPVFYSLLIPDFALFSLNQPLSGQNKRHAVKALFFSEPFT